MEDFSIIELLGFVFSTIFQVVMIFVNINNKKR